MTLLEAPLEPVVSVEFVLLVSFELVEFELVEFEIEAALMTETVARMAKTDLNCIFSNVSD